MEAKMYLARFKAFALLMILSVMAKRRIDLTDHDDDQAGRETTLNPSPTLQLTMCLLTLAHARNLQNTVHNDHRATANGLMDWLFCKNNTSNTAPTNSPQAVLGFGGGIALGDVGQPKQEICMG